MGKTIPYFYADLIARIVPGTVLIALVSITTLPIPKPWVDFVNSSVSGKAVIVPILFAGLAYVFGTILEALLSSALEWFYCFTFDRALREKYTPLYPENNDTEQKDIRPAKDLSRASYGHLICASTDNEKLAIPHIVRFHSEAKMCFSSATILFIFILLALAHKCSCLHLIKHIDNALIWLFIIVFTVPVLLLTTYQRLQSRAWFITRTIERSAAEDGSEATKTLCRELLTFCRKNK